MPESQLFLPEDGLKSHKLRSVRLQNKTLQRVRHDVKEHGDEPDESIALLIAETRILALELQPKRFAELAGMHYHAVKNVETPGTHPQHESYSRIYRFWEQRKVPKETRQKLLDLLVPETTDEGRPWRRSVEGLYWKWIYQKGEDKFAEASRHANPQQKPLTYGTIWQRHAVNVIPEYREPQIIGDRLDRDPGETGEIWTEQKLRRFQEQNVPPPLARLLTAMETGIDGIAMNIRGLVDEFGITQETAAILLKGRMPRIEALFPIVRRVIPAKEHESFLRELVACRPADTETFAEAFERVRDINGWTNREISLLLDVAPPEVRLDGYKSPRKEVYRPSHVLRTMYQDVQFSAQTPAKAAIDIITTPKNGGDPDEREREELETIFMGGVVEQLRTTAARNSRLRLQRTLCGVTPEELAEESAYDAATILKIERSELWISEKDENALIELTRNFAIQKAAFALEKHGEQQEILSRAPETVPSAIELLAERHGGYIPVERLTKDPEGHKVSIELLKAIAHNENCPPLPKLKWILQQGGLAFSPKLERDWYERMAEHLSQEQAWKGPLARGLGIIIYSKQNTVSEFWRENLSGDISYPSLTRNIQQLNGAAHPAAWPAITRHLYAAGMDRKDPQYAYIEQLFERQDDVRSGGKKSLHAAQETLIEWRKDMKGKRKDPEKYEFRLGLTRKERGLPDKKMTAKA